MRKIPFVFLFLVLATDAYAIPPPGRRNFYAVVQGGYTENLWTYHDSGYSASWYDPHVSPYGTALSPAAPLVSPTGLLDYAFLAGQPYGTTFVIEAWVHTFAPNAGNQNLYYPPSQYTLEYSPDLVRTGPEIVELFHVAGRNFYNGGNTLLHRTIDHTNVGGGGTATAWEDWGSPSNVVLCSSPSGASWGPGRIDVYVIGCDGNLWHAYSVNGWRGWDNWGAPAGHSLTGDPAAASWGDQRLDIFMRDSAGQILQAWYDHGSSGFGPWGNPNGVSFTSVGAAAFSVGEVYFGGLDSQSTPHLWLYRWANGPSSWEDLGAVPSGDYLYAVKFAGTAY